MSQEGGDGRRRMVKLGVALLLTATALHTSQAEELLVSGDFDSLSGWEELPIPPEFKREITEANSPFTEVYPDNGKCLLVADDPETPRAHMRYLLQSALTAARQLEFSMDFKMLEEHQASFVIALLSGDKQRVSVLTRPHFTLNLFAGSRSDERWTLPDKQQLEYGVWYHFLCRIDLDNATMEGKITSENGDAWDFVDHPIPVNPDNPQGTIDAILIGAHAGAKNHAPPTLMDNFSLRPISQEQ